MRADGAAGVAAELRAGASGPGLGWLIAGLFAAGAVLLALGGLCVGIAVQRPEPGAVPPRPGGAEVERSTAR